MAKLVIPLLHQKLGVLHRVEDDANSGLAALLAGARVSEKAFAEGRGPDPGRMCTIIAGCGGFVRGGFADQGPDADPFRSPPPVP